MSTPKKALKEFNIIIVGTGGQGLITLLRILAEAILIENFAVKTSELHGLSQRGGSVEVHIRFGEKIFSPLVGQGRADLILGLEAQECLNACYFCNENTIFLINDFFVPIIGEKMLEQKKISDELEKFSKKVIIVPAMDICEKELGNKVVAGIYLLSYAVHKNLIPLKTESLLKAIEKVVSKKYLELNKKAFELANKND